ncbi:Site-specific DNA recombinase [Flaviramulus basaltis]|uniref:Site-specific DNA recombinase n=1 Tax=Flaviramulus basaltis TaxID=369401 RepID=A0A1K2IPT3_9FLAO|nr:recombinase family protein [Flaviramulus basaltis]SFZ94452.1 Site-specific DNA recombinase [Flaviramulus basaltis]
MLGIYCRISKEKEEGKDRSIEDQRKLGIEKANELKLQYKVYIDEGYSGTLENINDRPQFSQLIDDIQDGIITTVYSYDQSRIERNVEVRFVIKRILKENNIKLYTDNGYVDLEDDQSEMLGDIVSIMNQYYVRLTTRKVKSILHRNAKEGKAHSSIYPYGYKKDENGFLVIDEEEAKIVKRIYDDSLKGIGTNKIAENLSNEGILTRYNKIGKGVINTKNKYTGKVTTTKKTDITWSGNSVRGILKNTIYKGVRKFGGKTYQCPILIEPSYWIKVNENLKNNRNNSGKKVEHKYLLKGILECGICGRNMYGRTRASKKDHYYLCSSKRDKKLNCGNRSVNIDFIEKYIWEIVLGDAYVKDELEKENKKEDKVDELYKMKGLLHSEIANIEANIKNVNRLVIEEFLSIQEGIKSKSSYQSKLDESTIRLKNIIDDLDYEKEAIKLRQTFGIDMDKIRIDTPYNKRKDLIFKYIKRAYIRYDDNIKHYFLTVKFKTKTGEQNYAFSSNRNRMRKFVETGEYEETSEEREAIIDNFYLVDDDSVETINIRSKKIEN